MSSARRLGGAAASSSVLGLGQRLGDERAPARLGQGERVGRRRGGDARRAACAAPCHACSAEAPGEPRRGLLERRALDRMRWYGSTSRPGDSHRREVAERPGAVRARSRRGSAAPSRSGGARPRCRPSGCAAAPGSRRSRPRSLDAPQAVRDAAVVGVGARPAGAPSPRCASGREAAARGPGTSGRSG